VGDLMSGWKSRKLWIAILAAAVAFGNAYGDWGMTVEQLFTIIAPLLAFIGVEGIADIKGR